MTDQAVIGRFIAEKRKAGNLTQKELAEQLHISDKTVSKWETGRSMPDYEYLPELTEILKISVNELLAGEDLPADSPTDYQRKAEETMTDLMKNSQDGRRLLDRALIGGVVGAAVVFLFLFFTLLDYLGADFSIVSLNTDIPTLLLLMLGLAFYFLLSGEWHAFISGFPIAFSRKTTPSDEAIHASRDAFRRTMLYTLLTMATIEVVSLATEFLSMGFSMRATYGTLESTMGIILLPLEYALIIEFLLFPIYARLSRMAGKRGDLW